MARAKSELCIGTGEDGGIWAIVENRQLNEDETEAILAVAAARRGHREQ